MALVHWDYWQLAQIVQQRTYWYLHWDTLGLALSALGLALGALGLAMSAPELAPGGTGTSPGKH